VNPLGLFATGVAAGLVAGGLSCAFAQAGLLAGAVGANAGRVRSTGVLVVAFLSAKLATHVMLGAALGALGAVLQPAPLIRALLLLVAGLVMATVAVRTYRARNGLAHCATEPPAREVGGIRAAVMFGLATVLVPCGVTLTMEMIAVAGHSPLGGAAVMAGFVIGTVPLFGLLGLAIGRMMHWLRGRLAVVSVVAMLTVAAWTFSSGLRLAGWWPQTPATAEAIDARYVGTDPAGFQIVTIGVLRNGYRPTVLAAQAGVPTILVLRAHANSGCTRVFVIASRGVQAALPADGDTRVDLGRPARGPLRYTCAMGMYTGTITFR
jgi:sulfite exporter TauE/SafE